MITEFRNCAAEIPLTDSQIAGIIRSIAVNDGVTPNLYAVSTTAICRMARGHEGDCGGWVATLDDDEEETDARTCWLRWNDMRRQLAWLPDCPVEGCLLYQHHLGACNPICDPAPGVTVPDIRTVDADQFAALCNLFCFAHCEPTAGDDPTAEQIGDILLHRAYPVVCDHSRTMARAVLAYLGFRTGIAAADELISEVHAAMRNGKGSLPDGDNEPESATQ
jgi:hypothetical protein